MRDDNAPQPFPGLVWHPDAEDRWYVDDERTCLAGMDAEGRERLRGALLRALAKLDRFAGHQLDLAQDRWLTEVGYVPEQESA